VTSPSPSSGCDPGEADKERADAARKPAGHPRCREHPVRHGRRSHDHHDRRHRCCGRSGQGHVFPPLRRPGRPPLGPGTPAPERITAVLDAIVEVKLSNRQITHALEHLDQRADRGSFFDTPGYQRAHALFTDLLAGIVSAERATWTAHVLLSLTRMDLIEQMVTVESWTGQHVRDQIRDFCEQLLREAAGHAPSP
jgi:hypothetical protein